MRNVEERRGISGVGDSDGVGGDSPGRCLRANSQVVYLVALSQLALVLAVVHLVPRRIRCKICNCNVSALKVLKR